MTANSEIVLGPGHAIRTWFGWHRPLAVFVASMTTLAMVATIGVLTDDRYLAGAPVWLKPLKFAISFAIFGISLGWIISRMRHRVRWTAVVGTVFAVGSLIEVGLITLQAARGRESHFNERATDLDSVITRGMAAMVVVLWVTTVVVAVAATRQRIGDRAATSAVRLGLFISVAGAALGVLMLIPTPEQQQAMADGVITLSGAHSVGAAHGGPGLPFTGWTTEGGDLRVPHFVGIHALQALPLLAWLLARPQFALIERARVVLVRIGAIGYAGLVAITLWQALRGQPLIAPDGLTLGALAVLVLGVAVGITRVVTRHPTASTT